MANLGFSACSLLLGSIALSMACSNGGGDGQAETSGPGDDSTGEPSSAASSESADDAATSADDGGSDDETSDTGLDDDA
ncbi:MAG TPA: hypothetical protein VFG69_00115, partial [Nannocystaceae bacterium]|nr:hypothetical protein [Nannocystaceae bacterium]